VTGTRTTSSFIATVAGRGASVVLAPFTRLLLIVCLPFGCSWTSVSFAGPEPRP
jgi:hypothetical protein